VLHRFFVVAQHGTEEKVVRLGSPSAQTEERRNLRPASDFMEQHMNGHFSRSQSETVTAAGELARRIPLLSRQLIERLGQFASAFPTELKKQVVADDNRDISERSSRQVFSRTSFNHITTRFVVWTILNGVPAV
jgi:hypothetical protein